MIRFDALTQTDVLLDVPGEQEGVLGHHRQVPSQRGQVQLPHVHPVDQDPTPLGAVKAQDQVHDGGLPRAGGAHQRHPLPRGNPERDPLEHPVLVSIGKPHVPKLDLPPERGHRPGAGRLLRLIQQLEDALGGGHGRLEDVVFVRQVRKRLEKHPHVAGESHQCPQGEDPGQHPPPAVPDEQGQGQRSHHRDGRAEDPIHDHRPHLGPVVSVVDLLESAEGSELLAEQLDDGHPGDGLGEVGVEPGQLPAGLPVSGPGPGPEPEGEREKGRPERQKQ